MEAVKKTPLSISVTVEREERRRSSRHLFFPLTFRWKHRIKKKQLKFLKNGNIQQSQ